MAIWLIERRWPPASGAEVPGIGWAWLVLTIVFEFMMGPADNPRCPIVLDRFLRPHTEPLRVASIGGAVVLAAVGFFPRPVALAVTRAPQIWRTRGMPGASEVSVAAARSTLQRTD